MTPGGEGGFRPRFFIQVRPEFGLRPGVELSLAPTDARHALAVLRARPGDLCEVVLTPAAAGPAEVTPSFAGPTATPPRLFQATLEPSRREVRVRLAEECALAPARLRVLLLQALPAPRSVDVILEKGTEVGIDAFLLFRSQGSPDIPLERLRGRLERWRRIAEEAAKQSKQLAVPSVAVAASLEEALDRAAGARIVALEPSASQSFQEALLGPRPPRAGEQALALVVGPESGWAAAEVDLFSRRNVERATLGRRILRAETAGPVAGAVARFALGDW